MKKSLSLIALIMAALLCGFTAFASDVSFSGEFDYGGMTDGDSYAGTFGKIELDMNVTVDEYNTFSMEIEDADTTNALDGDLPLSISYAEITTDWGSLLSLPVGVTTTAGYNGYGVGGAVGLTGWGLECYGGLWNDAEGGVQLDLTLADMITLTGAYNYDFATDDTLDLIVGANVSTDDLVFVVGYGIAGGDITAEAQYSLALASEMSLGFAGSVYYDLADAVAGSTLFYGLGASYGVAGLTLGVGFNGNDSDAFSSLGVDVDYAVNDQICVDAATIFDMSSAAADTFLGVDLSATYSAGATAFTVGYLYSDGNGASSCYNCETSLADGGVYGAVRIDY